MSHSATSTGAQAFMPSPRRPLRIGRRLHRRSRSNGSRPSISGLRTFKMGPNCPCPPPLKSPTKQLPSMPSSVWMRSTPCSTSPKKRPRSESRPVSGRRASDDFYLYVVYLQFSFLLFMWIYISGVLAGGCAGGLQVVCWRGLVPAFHLQRPVFSCSGSFSKAAGFKYRFGFIVD